MSKTRQCLKTLNGGNLDTVQELWDSSRILGQDSVKNFFKILSLGGNLFQFNSLENLSTIYNEIGHIYNRLE